MRKRMLVPLVLMPLSFACAHAAPPREPVTRGDYGHVRALLAKMVGEAM